MAEMILMPKLGMDMEEGTILRWIKKAGDPVKKGEAVAEIETDKTSMELESPADGVILALFLAEGESIAVKKPVAAVGQPGEKVEGAEAAGAAAAAVPASVPAEPAVVPAEPAATPAPEISPVPAAAPAPEISPAPVAAPAPAGQIGGKVKASPRARRLAARENIPLSLRAGSGPGGRIKERDVRAFIAAGKPGAAGSLWTIRCFSPDSVSSSFRYWISRLQTASSTEWTCVCVRSVTAVLS